MSVAFRRDSDEEHLEPRFALPIPAGPNLVTARGLALIKAKVEALEPLVASLADGEGKTEAQRDLRYWRTRLATAQLVQPQASAKAAFGSRVRFILKGTTRTVDLVGDDEAEPAEGRIAFSSPLARSLIGSGAGDFTDFAGHEDAIEVLEVGAILSI